MYTLISPTASTERRAKILPLSHRSTRHQTVPNQLVIAIVQPINLNVFCKLHLYALQKTRSRWFDLRWGKISENTADET